jgi:hypothetical protein
MLVFFFVTNVWGCFLTSGQSSRRWLKTACSEGIGKEPGRRLEVRSEGNCCEVLVPTGQGAV